MVCRTVDAAAEHNKRCGCSPQKKGPGNSKVGGPLVPSRPHPVGPDRPPHRSAANVSITVIRCGRARAPICYGLSAAKSARARARDLFLIMCSMCCELYVFIVCRIYGRACVCCVRACVHACVPNLFCSIRNACAIDRWECALIEFSRARTRSDDDRTMEAALRNKIRTKCVAAIDPQPSSGTHAVLPNI